MNSSIYKFTLDLHRNQSQISIPVMQNDTARIFNIALSERGKPYRIADGCLAMMSIKRPTGTYIETFCPIVDNTYIKYDFGENEDTAVVEGLHNCQVSVFDADGDFISSAKFTMVVHSRAVTSDDIEITDTDRGIIDSIVVTEAGRVNAETARNEAETERVAAENLRVESENSRNTAEMKREDSMNKAIEGCNTAAEKANTISDILKNKLESGELVGDSKAMIITLSGVTAGENVDGETHYTYSAISRTYDEILEHISNGGVAFVEYDIGFLSMRIPYSGMIGKTIIQFTQEYGNVCTIIEIVKLESGETAASIRTYKVKAVSYEEQTLTDEQKEQARKNIGIDELPSGGSGMPDVTTNENGKVMMVVDGKWEIVDLPTGTQYDIQRFSLPTDGWYEEEDHYTCYVEYEHISASEDLIIDVAVKSDFTMMAEAWRCGVFCAATDSKTLIFNATEIPEIEIEVDVRITKPKGLSYALNEEDMTVTIIEG